MLFSVIVPIYKVEAYLRKCVDSILAQECGDFELILVDDGSPDGCPAICDAYAEEDARVRVIHKENGGVVSARNTGIRKAKGEYICYVDGDDWVTPDWLKSIRQMLEQAPQKLDILAFGARMLFQDHEEEIGSSLEEGFYAKDRLEKEIYPFLISDRRLLFGRGIIFSVAWNKVYKKSLLRKYYCRDERLTVGEDTAFTIKCFLHAENAYISNRVFYLYNRMNEGSELTKYNPDRLKAVALEYHYLSTTLRKEGTVIQKQLNDLYAKGIMAGVFHEMVAGRPIGEAARNLARVFRETGILRYVSLRGLPPFVMAYILLLRLRMYRVALLGAKAWLRRNPMTGI